LAHATRALQKPDLLTIADATMDMIEARWTSPKGGFFEGEVDGPPRRQNPHMHLLEAALALWEVSTNVRWKKIANDLVTLSRTKFFDFKTGALTEYFVEDWARRPGVEGGRVEPGHCFEWAWLFERLSTLGLMDDIGTSSRLVAFARRFGIDPNRGVAINEVFLDGTVRNGDARLWPQTERMKAALAGFRRTGDKGEAHEAVSAFLGLQLYFDVCVKGLWRDVLSADGSFIEQPAPASSFYHIICGISELLSSVNGRG
jgi:mannose-6-phosphate isomerase